jgi:hypothetical protein
MLFLPYESAVLVGRAEIDIDATDAVAGKRMEFRVAEFLTVFRATSVEHENVITVRDDLL